MHVFLLVLSMFAVFQPERDARVDSPVDRRAAIEQIVRSYQLDPASDQGESQWTTAMAMIFEGAAIARAFEAQCEPLREQPDKQQHVEWLLVAYADRDAACTPELEAEAERCLDRFRAVHYFDRLRSAPASNVVAPLWQTPVARQGGIGIRDIRLLGFIHSARIREASDNGDIGEIGYAVSDMLALSRVAAGSPESTSQATAVALRTWAARRLIAEALHGRLPDRAWAFLEGRFERSPMPPVSALLDLQRHMALEYLDWICEQLRLDSKDAKFYRQLGLDRSDIVHRASAAAVCNEWIDRAIEYGSDDPEVRKRGRESRFEIEKGLVKAQRATRARLTEEILPASQGTVERHRMQRCLEAGLRVMSAIERYRAEHGACPDALEALVPTYLKKVPLDLCAENKPLAYKRIDPETDPLKRSYLLYSVGFDGIDDGGVPSGKGPDGYGRRYEKGADFIINAVE